MRQTPSRLTSTIVSQNSGSWVRTVSTLFGAMPALATATSSPPKRSTASETAAST